jgi:hypothetical protein
MHVVVTGDAESSCYFSLTLAKEVIRIQEEL